MKQVRVRVDALETDGATQSRTALRDDIVSEYRDAMREGSEFPPIQVVTDGETMWVTDGWHRVAAARAIAPDAELDALVASGSLQDAIWEAAKANKTHGLRRCNADKVRSVTMAIQVRPKATLREIASWCGVSHEMVRQYKQAMEAENEVADAARDVDDAAQHADVQEDDPVVVAMADAKTAIDRVRGAIDRAREMLDGLIETPAGIWINRQSVVSDLQNASSALSHASPYAECPLCAGAGCPTCRDGGWVSKKQWQLIPKSR